MKYIKTETITISKIACLYETVPLEEMRRVHRRYPFRVTPHYAGLLKEEGDAIWRQCIPDQRELDDLDQVPDPLAEAVLSPVPGLIHRYPDRVVLLISNRCAMYCRFCMRKRLVGEGDAPLSGSRLEAALAYINSRRQIRDVVLSGGDPLMLDDESLAELLGRLRTIGHLSIIRIGTRIPVTFPERITPELCSILKRFHPLYVNTHFNHPRELTPAAAMACGRLADAGIPLGNQSVLLAGVNDSIECMRELVTGLLALRIRPYYLHQMDLVRGTSHFRTSVARGLEIIRGLRGHISGMAVPHYVIDLPGGKGKVALLPEEVERNGNLLTLTTYNGERVIYSDLV